MNWKSFYIFMAVYAASSINPAYAESIDTPDGAQPVVVVAAPEAPAPVYGTAASGAPVATANGAPKAEGAQEEESKDEADKPYSPLAAFGYGGVTATSGTTGILGTGGSVGYRGKKGLIINGGAGFHAETIIDNEAKGTDSFTATADAWNVHTNGTDRKGFVPSGVVHTKNQFGVGAGVKAHSATYFGGALTYGSDVCGGGLSLGAGYVTGNNFAGPGQYATPPSIVAGTFGPAASIMGYCQIFKRIHVEGSAFAVKKLNNLNGDTEAAGAGQVSIMVPITNTFYTGLQASAVVADDREVGFVGNYTGAFTFGGTFSKTESAAAPKAPEAKKAE